jgi:iron(III) transport system substrate-binding protein
MRFMLALGLTLLTAAGAVAAETPFGSPDLVEKARAEGKIVFYSVNFTETELPWIKAFNQRFPFIRVELVRAPGGQMLTRINTEYASGKLAADVIDYSDRGHLLKMLDMYQEYAPPNAEDYKPEAVTDPRKLWPRSTTGWCLAYNTALVDTPPTSWWDLTAPQWKGKQIAQVIAGGGGPTWNRALFERKVLGEDYWVKLAANDPALYPSGAPETDAIIRGEAKLGATQTNIALPRVKEGAPLGCAMPKEGMPVTSYGAGIPKTAVNVNAARLFLNWSLSREGQEAFVRDSSGFSALKDGPVPEGIDLKQVRLWYSDMDDYINLQTQWIEDWNRTFNYRQ